MEQLRGKVRLAGEDRYATDRMGSVFPSAVTLLLWRKFSNA
ncbi:hypothetical protein [Desulfosporosinus lacus]|nr:hypothetical protein [Desulfosporosinus lacus]